MVTTDKLTEIGTDKMFEFRATVNDRPVVLNISEDKSLLDVLRDDLGLTGAKRGCDVGTCGSCAVILNGRALDACVIMAKDTMDAEIQTIEGVEKDGVLHPLQEAFIEQDGLQCGFCTPGQIMAGKALLDANPSPTEDEVKRGLAGNLRRCA